MTHGFKRGVPRVGILLLAAALALPWQARAEDCAALTRERSRIIEDIGDLLETYPGTHAVIGICGAAAAQSYDETKNPETARNNFAACAVIGCAIAGFDNCVNVTVKWFGLALRNADLETRMKRNYC